MLKHPGWWLADSAQIYPKTGGGYEVKNISSSDIAHALGLQSSDVFISINSMALDDVVDAAAAIEALRTETSFTLVVRRGVNNVTLEYEKI